MQLRTALILGGDFFTGTVLAASLTKLVLRFEGLSSDKVKVNGLKAEVCTPPAPGLPCVDKKILLKGDVDHDVHNSRWAVEIRKRPD
jgi:hypothetical protein